MAYNLTGIVDNGTTVLGFVQGVDSTLMSGWLGTLFLIGVTAICFIAFIQTTGDTNKSVAAAAFISFGLSILLRAIGLIHSNLVIFITLIGLAISLAFSWRE